MCVSALHVKGSSKSGLTKFTPAVVMSAGSLDCWGSEAPASLVCKSVYSGARYEVISCRGAKHQHLGEVGIHSPLPWLLDCPPWPVMNAQRLSLAESVSLIRSSFPSDKLTFHTPGVTFHLHCAVLLCAVDADTEQHYLHTLNSNLPINQFSLDICRRCKLGLTVNSK